MASVDEVRALIPDVREPQMFTDSEIATYIALASDDSFEAAAFAVEALATEIAMTGNTVRTDDLTIQNSDGASLLFKRAGELRAQSAGGGDDFQIVFPYAAKAWAPTEAVPYWHGW